METKTLNGEDDVTKPLTARAVKQEPEVEPKRRSRICRFLRENLLLLLTLSGVLLGVALGFAIRPLHPSDDVIMWLGLPGKLYLRSLKMMIVPLIICSVISGTASLDAKTNGKITVVAFVFIFLTNTLGSLIGVASSLVFRPGAGSTGYSSGSVDEPMETQDIFADLLRNIVPDNLIEATFSKAQTRYTYTNQSVMRNTSDGLQEDATLVVSKRIGTSGGANVLGLIFACTLLGMASGKLRPRTSVVIDFFAGCTDVCILVIRWLMWSTPIGVLCLIAVAIADVKDITAVFSGVGMFIVTVVAGIAVQQLVAMPLIYFIGIRKNPLKFYLSISRPWLIAFAAASTAVTIPEMLWSCEVKNKVDSRAARFVIPFSVTLSANGSAIFITSSCLFVARLTGIAPSVVDIITIGLLSAVSSLAIPSVPSASIVTIIMILSSLNIRVEAVALLLALEWLLDRLRTTSSVVSHVMCAVFTDKLCKNVLKDMGNEIPLDVEVSVHGSRDHIAIPMQDASNCMYPRPVANGHDSVVKL